MKYLQITVSIILKILVGVALGLYILIVSFFYSHGIRYDFKTSEVVAYNTTFDAKYNFLWLPFFDFLKVTGHIPFRVEGSIIIKDWYADLTEDKWDRNSGRYGVLHTWASWMRGSEPRVKVIK